MPPPRETRSTPVRVCLETAPVLTVALLTFAVLGYLLRSSWAPIFFYNGDSIVLPLVQQSLHTQRPFDWTFSSQLFLFPEAPFYAACAAVSAVVSHGSPRVTLSLNAILNVAMLYVLLRLCARWLCAQLTPVWQSAVAAGAAGYYLLFALTERIQNLSAGTIATLFMTTTYYYGVILAGLAALVLVLVAARGFATPAVSPRSAHATVSIGALALLGALTTLSDPLFLVQVVPSLGVSLGLAFLLRRDFRLLCLGLLAGLLLGCAVGFVARGALGDLIGSGTGTYIKLSQVHASVSLVLDIVGAGIAQPHGVVKAVLFVGMLGCSVAALVRARRAGEHATAVRVVAVWSLVSPLLLLAATFATGSLVTRYLIPVFVFPLAGLPALAATARRPRLRRFYLAGLLAGTTTAAATLVAVGLPGAASAIDGSPQIPGLTCLEQWLGGRSLTGAGSFWVTRPLNLYGAPDGVHLLQVQPGNAKPFLWMIDQSRFVDHRVTYLLVLDEDLDGPDWPELASSLGPPASVTDCQAFKIYDYRRTRGARVLTRRASGSAAKVSSEYARG